MNQQDEEEPAKPEKLVPVIFFDEAHRLPLLIRDRKAMKCILDAMLVLTKQVRQDPFFENCDADSLCRIASYM